MNLSNKITLSRILIMPIFIIALERGSVFWKSIAMLCFAYACYSDWLDGMLARKHNWVTDFGKFADPLADKIFICAAFISFVGIPIFHIPAWIVTVIIAREFMITGFRTIAVSKEVVVPAHILGKSKTIVQLVTIGAIILISLLYEMSTAGFFMISKGFSVFLGYLPMLLMWLSMIITLVSGFQYLWANKGMFKGD